MQDHITITTLSILEDTVTLEVRGNFPHPLVARFRVYLEPPARSVQHISGDRTFLDTPDLRRHYRKFAEEAWERA
jgi:hypothetical protein